MARVTRVGSLIAELGMDTSRFNQGMSRANARIQNSMKDWRQRLRATADRLGAIGKTMSLKLTAPMLALGAAGLGLAIRLGTVANRLLDMRSALGFSLELLQGLRLVAARAGIPFEDFAQIFQSLNEELRGVRTEEDTPEVFQELGVALFDAEGNMRPLFDIFLDTIDSLGQLDSATRRAALGTELFGQDWMFVAPLMDLGREGIEATIRDAKELGLVLKDETIESANEFRISVEELKLELDNLLLRLAVELLPLLKDDLVPLIREDVVPALRSFLDVVGDLADKFQELPKPVQGAVGILLLVLAVVGPLVLVAGVLVGIVSNLILVAPFLGAAFLALTGPIGLLVAALAGGILIGLALIFNWFNIRTKAEEHWSAIAEIIADKTGAAENTVQLFMDRLLLILFPAQGLAFLIGREWGKITDVIQGIWDTGVSIVRDAVNRMISFINDIIAAWNNLEFGVGPFTVGVGDFARTIGPWTFGTPDVPFVKPLHDPGAVSFLARGGIVTEPTMAVIGEAGPEAVVPLGAAGGMGGTIIIQGDVFGFDEFQRRVAQAGMSIQRGGGWDRRGRSNR